MNGEPNHSDTDPGVDRVIPRIEELHGRIVEQTQSRRRRQRVVLGAGLAVVAAVFVSLYSVTVQSRALDARTVTNIGRHEIEKRLPITRQALEDHLLEEAPRLVDSGLHALVDRLPDLRAYAMQGLTERFGELTDDFESQSERMLDARIRAVKRNLDATYPDLGDREQLEKLVELVAAEFNRNFESLSDVLYPRYSAEVNRVNRGIARLHACRPEDLSREDRLKKEIIETMVQLALKDGARE